MQAIPSAAAHLSGASAFGRRCRTGRGRPAEAGSHGARRILRLLVLLAVALAACGKTPDGPPHIEVDRTACAHCGMLVSERIYAAAYQAPGADARVFDDIACLLAAVRDEPQTEPLSFWFHDAATGSWVSGTEAVFVKSSGLQTPMGGGMLAYGDPDAARRAAAEHRGEVVGSLQDLLAGAAQTRKDGRR